MTKTHLNNHEYGMLGEDLAARFLESEGLKLIERNWRTREGEIDIIAQDDVGVIHFCEVKTRRSLAAGNPLEAISKKKALRLQRLALSWMLDKGVWGQDFQIDCVGIIFANGVHTIDFRPDVL
jgi:putative endonuclease